MLYQSSIFPWSLAIATRKRRGIIIILELPKLANSLFSYKDSFLALYNSYAYDLSLSSRLPSKVNHMARAHLVPFPTAFTPCKFSGPEENPTIRPHLGLTALWKKGMWSRFWKLRYWTIFTGKMLWVVFHVQNYARCRLEDWWQFFR